MTSACERLSLWPCGAGMWRGEQHEACISVGRSLYHVGSEKFLVLRSWSHESRGASQASVGLGCGTLQVREGKWEKTVELGEAFWGSEGQQGNVFAWSQGSGRVSQERRREKPIGARPSMPLTSSHGIWNFWLWTASDDSFRWHFEKSKSIHVVWKELEWWKDQKQGKQLRDSYNFSCKIEKIFFESKDKEIN